MAADQKEGQEDGQGQQSADRRSLLPLDRAHSQATILPMQVSDISSTRHARPPSCASLALRLPHLTKEKGHSRMLIHKLRRVVDLVMNDQEQILLPRMFRDLCKRECLRHLALLCSAVFLLWGPVCLRRAVGTSSDRKSDEERWRLLDGWCVLGRLERCGVLKQGGIQMGRDISEACGCGRREIVVVRKVVKGTSSYCSGTNTERARK